jgi:hypothetical protein
MVSELLMNIYAYKILNLVSDQSGIVVAVDFTIEASDGSDSFAINGHTALPVPTDKTIAYESLTEDDVIAWVQTLVGEQMQEQADAELEAYKIRKVLTSGAPWA